MLASVFLLNEGRSSSDILEINPVILVTFFVHLVLFDVRVPSYIIQKQPDLLFNRIFDTVILAVKAEVFKSVT